MQRPCGCFINHREDQATICRRHQPNGAPSLASLKAQWQERSTNLDIGFRLNLEPIYGHRKRQLVERP